MDKIELYDTDYVLFKNGKPLETLDIIYAKESIEELFEDGFELEEGEEFIKMPELPTEWQEKYIAEIKKLKYNNKDEYYGEAIACPPTERRYND